MSRSSGRDKPEDEIALRHASELRELGKWTWGELRARQGWRPLRLAAFAGSDFRVGPYGRFEWATEGQHYYRQFLPPSLQRMEAPADFLLRRTRS